MSLKNKKTVKITNFNKKQYYITEGHIDEDGNEYEKDYSGPFTLNKARRLMEYYFKSSYHFRNPYNLNIRGPGL